MRPFLRSRNSKLFKANFPYYNNQVCPNNDCEEKDTQEHCIDFVLGFHTTQCALRGVPCHLRTSWPALDKGRAAGTIFRTPGSSLENSKECRCCVWWIFPNRPSTRAVNDISDTNEKVAKSDCIENINSSGRSNSRDNSENRKNCDNSEEEDYLVYTKIWCRW